MIVKRFLFLMPLIVLAIVYGCTKERELVSPGDDLTCLGCHSDEAALQALLADSNGSDPPTEASGDG